MIVLPELPAFWKAWALSLELDVWEPSCLCYVITGLILVSHPWHLGHRVLVRKADPAWEQMTVATSLLSVWWSPPGHVNVPITMLSGESQMPLQPGPVAFAERSLLFQCLLLRGCLLHCPTSSPHPFSANFLSFHLAGRGPTFKTQHLLQKLQI